MLIGRNDPFQALFNLQRALDTGRRSDWLRGSTAGRGSFPPINILQKGDDFVAIVELAGIDKSDLEIVLLTRARLGTVIWVPEGDCEDQTRSISDFDAISNFLKLSQRC